MHDGPPEDDEASREHRRAEGAADSVSLAAAGASSGFPGAPEEPALPATTLLAVEENAELPAEQPLEDLASDDLASDRGPEVDDLASDRDPETDDEFAEGRLDPSDQAAAEVSDEPSPTATGESADGGRDESFAGELSDEAAPGEPAGGPTDESISGSWDDPGEAVVGPFDEPAGEPADEAVVGPFDEPADEAVIEPLEARGDPSDETLIEPIDELAGPADEAVTGPLDEHADSPDEVVGEPAVAGAPVGDGSAAAAGDDSTPTEGKNGWADRKWGRLGPRHGAGGSDLPAQLLSRPLGSAPLLDSDPLPATRPGMLRPRHTEPADDDGAEGFSLPVQRPAFDVGSGEPADIT